MLTGLYDLVITEYFVFIQINDSYNNNICKTIEHFMYYIYLHFENLGKII